METTGKVIQPPIPNITNGLQTLSQNIYQINNPIWFSKETFYFKEYDTKRPLPKPQIFQLVSKDNNKPVIIEIPRTRYKIIPGHSPMHGEIKIPLKQPNIDKLVDMISELTDYRFCFYDISFDREIDIHLNICPKHTKEGIYRIFPLAHFAKIRFTISVILNQKTGDKWISFKEYGQYTPMREVTDMIYSCVDGWRPEESIKRSEEIDFYLMEKLRSIDDILVSSNPAVCLMTTSLHYSEFS